MLFNLKNFKPFIANLSIVYVASVFLPASYFMTMKNRVNPLKPTVAIRVQQ